MALLARSEWFEEQKQAVVLAPGKSFQVIQTTSGSSVFLSIGSDGVFYATREVLASNTGWNRIDLSSRLAAQFNGTKVVAKSFAVSQNQETLTCDVALVLNVAGKDHLYLSFSHANTVESWSAGLSWGYWPFDDKDRSEGLDKLSYAGVYLINLPAADKPNGAQTCCVDVLRGTPDRNTQRVIDRYYLDLVATTHWKKHMLPVEMAADTISNQLGRRDRDRIGGMYTFGKLEDRTQLIFSPAFNVFDESVKPNPARPSIPEGSTAIASTFNAAGRSTLFIASKQGISAWAPDNQGDEADSTLIIDHPLVSQARNLSAESMGGITAIYGVTTSGDLFYSWCPAGSEVSAMSWSCPAPLAAQVDQYSFYVNKPRGNNVLFVHGQGKDLLQITQDPVTKHWASRVILLPSTDINDVLKFEAFSTRITLKNLNQPSAKNAEVLLTATSPIGVFVNDTYRVLNPDVPIKAITDANSVIRIVQPTQDSVAICYKASLVESPKTLMDIDPADNMKSRLAALKTKEDLDKANIQLPDGTSRPLVPNDVTGQEREAAVKAIQQMVSITAELPKDGSRSGKATVGSGSPNSSSSTKTVLSIDSQPTARISIASAAVADVKGFFMSAGDLFRSLLNTAWNALKNFTVKLVKGVYQVLVQIGDKIYQAVLDCAAAVQHAVEWVFSKIKVAIEDIKAFLGFVFNWRDIVRTHKVIKNVATQYAYHGISRVGDLKASIDSGFSSVEQQLLTWANIPTDATTMGQRSDSTKEKHPSYDDPQSHYVHDKASEHMNDAETSTKAAEPTGGEWQKALNDLKGLATTEGDAVKHTIDMINTQILTPFRSLTISEIIKRLAAILGQLVLATAKNILNTTLGLIQDLGAAVVKELNEPIKIPVISSLYKKIADEDLSIMDLVCLAAAVPATIIYKAITGTAPFPDSSTTRALISASDYKTIQTTISGDAQLLRTFTITSEFVAMAGLLFEVITNAFKLKWMEDGKPHEVPDKIKQVSIPVKLLAIMPSYISPRLSSDPWYMKMNAMVTDFALLKVCLDATEIGGKELYGTVSPYIDYAISASWLIPSVAKIIENHNNSQSKGSSITTLTTEVAYDIAIMTGPVIWNPSMDKEAKLYIIAGANIVIGVCAVIKVATGGLLQDGK